MTELSEAPPVVVGPVQWLVRSVAPPVEPLAEASPLPVRRRQVSWWACAPGVVVTAAAVAYHLLRGGSPAISAALVVIVLAVSLRGGTPSHLAGSGTATSLHHLVVCYAAVSTAVVIGAVSTEALPEAAVLFATGGVVLVATAFVHGRARQPVRVLVVGDRAAVSRAAMQWGASSRIDVVGGVLIDRAVDDGQTSVVGVPSVAGVEATLAHLRRCRADAVLVSPGPGLSGLDVRRLAWQLEGTGVELGVLGLADHAAPHRVRAVPVDGGTVLRLLPTRPSWPVRLAKQVVDRGLGGVLLLAAAPLIGLLVVLVRLDSPGPGIFRQTRVGRDEAPFTMLKLRTMHQNADEDLGALASRNEAGGPLFKIHDDPRVTRVGRVLRRLSLDELPQLVNVVRGEMSLVGPRPALPNEVACYDDVERRRLHVLPGLTGLWQVSGRSDLGWDSGMALDLRYTDNWRLRDDVSILARTFGAVVRRRGAY